MALVLDDSTGWATNGTLGTYYIRQRIEVTSQSIENNTSTVNVKAWIYSQSGSSLNNISTILSQSIGGVSMVNGYYNISVGSGSSTLILDNTRIIPHNADGTLSVRAISYFNNTYTGVHQIDRTLVVNTIPRATTPTWSGNFIAGTAKTISLPRASSGFTHDVTYTFHSTTGTIGTGSGVSVSWTPPLSLLDSIPNTAISSGTITVVTKSGTTVIGSKATTFTLEAGADIIPTISSVAWSDTNSTVATNIGAFVQGASKLKGVVTASGIRSSTITSRHVTVAGTQYANDTIFTPNTSGTITASGTATDSRGRSRTTAANFSVLAYTPPTVSSLNVFRSNASSVAASQGEYLSVTLSAAVQSLLVSSTQKNSMTLTIATKETTAAGGYTTRNTLTRALSTTETILVGGGQIYLQTKSYDVRVQVSDKTGTLNEFIITVPVAAVTIDMVGNSVGVGKLWEAGTLDVGGDTYVRGDLYVEDVDAAKVSTDEFYIDGVRNGGYLPLETVYFTSNGTFTKGSYPRARALKVRLVGGGGGGGGALAASSGNNTLGAGGGGGGYAESFITDLSTVPSTVSITVGAGGAGGSGTGGTGGTSSFGSLVVAAGGTGGTSKSNDPYAPYVSGGLGGTGTSGQLLIGGQGGGAGASHSSLATGGNGGNSQLGGGGRASGTGSGSSGLVGAAGENYGGGGGGAMSNGGGPARVGGVGGPGIVIIEIFA